MESKGIESKLQKDSIFRVGRVISVDGRTVRAIVDKTKNSANLLYEGELIKNVSVNSYIKIVKGFTKIIGKVDGEYTDEDKTNKAYYGKEKDRINRVLQISLLGFFGNKGFERGIKELPLIGNECFLLDNNEFNLVHDFLKKGDEPLNVGTLTHEKGLNISIGVNSLFASHIGIFGNTGSGKSYTLSRVYNSLFSKFAESAKFEQNASFYFIDFNGEYVEEDRLIDADRKSSFVLSTVKPKGENHFPIASKHIEDFKFWSLILEATEKTQMPFIRRALKSDKIASKISSKNLLIGFINQLVEKVIVKEDKNLKQGIITDFLTNIGESIDASNLDSILNALRSNLGFHNQNSTYIYIDPNSGETLYGIKAVPEIKKIIDTLDFEFKSDKISQVRLSLILKYHDEIISGFSNQEHLSPLINRIAGKIKDLNKLIEVNDSPNLKNICVISLRDVNVQMRKMLPFLICKQLYEEKKESNEKEKSLNIIIDEAHNILSDNSERESEAWKDYRLETFEEIIKEGRKFGVFLTIASQRPSDISPTIISQLHNFFLHRLINNNDIRAVEKTISYLDKLSFESLPILPTGTCIFAGLAAQVPVMIDIGKIEDKKYEPDNKTIVLLDNWKDD